MIIKYLILHEHQLIWGILIFIVSFAISSIGSVFVILRLSDDHFHVGDRISKGFERPRWQRVMGMVIRNVFGAGLLILGLIMALPGVPGQGFLTMFIGLVLLDFPGKRALERRIIARPTILLACNRLRIRFGKKPFTLAIQNDDQQPMT